MLVPKNIANYQKIFLKSFGEGGLLPVPRVNHYAEHIQVQNQHLVLEKNPDCLRNWLRAEC